jgi:hypothetical protein
MYGFNAVHLNRKIGSIKVSCLHYVSTNYVCLNYLVSVYYMTVFKSMENLFFPFKSLRFQGIYHFSVIIHYFFFAVSAWCLL